MENLKNKTKLESIEIMAKDLIKFYCPSFNFVWDRSLRRKGQYRPRECQIGISKPLAELNTIECMLLTVVHEIAHALNPGENHSRIWKDSCISLGGDGRPTYSSDEVEQPSKWILYHRGEPTSIKRYRRCHVQKVLGYEWRKEIKEKEITK